jgi:hypothetical protein
VPVEPALQLRLRRCADKPVKLLAVPYQHQQWDALRAVAGRDPRRCVDVQLDDLQPAGSIPTEPLDDRRDHAAGTAPGAQKSISTGTEAVISESKLCSSASTIHGSDSWQTPQRGVPLGVGRTRLSSPQLGHLIVIAIVVHRLAENGLCAAFASAWLAQASGDYARLPGEVARPRPLGRSYS